MEKLFLPIYFVSVSDLFYVNRTTILENDPEFSSKFKIASIVLGWIVGVVLILSDWILERSGTE